MFERFKQDTARWVVPQQVADPSSITLGTTLKLLLRYMPLRAMLWFRFGNWCDHKGIPFMPGFAQRWIYRWYGLEIGINLDIGGGLYIAHPIGAVIVVNQMGENCSIIAAATLGLRNEYAFPTIGDNVFIGAGARILGGITIGDGAIIGANAVVISDVPAKGTAVGIPAKVIRIDGEKQADPINH